MNKPVFKLNSEFKLPMGVLAGALMPGDKQVVAGCLDGVYKVDLGSKSFEKLYSHDSYVSSVASIGGESILSAGYDGCLRWFNEAAGGLTRIAKVHDFWSWDMAISSDQKLFASVTGQYLADGYKYEPMVEREPSLRIGSIETGRVLHSLPHVPSVQAVAFSPDGKSVAAGNLMGEVRIFDSNDGALKASFTTNAFTSWGIIKSHSYIGGIFAIQFTPDGSELLLAGMGQMRDPMAANGRQLWERWAWNQPQPTKSDETHEGESGEGLMETLAIHPSGEHFLMGGRLRGGNWSVAVFDLATGGKVAELKAEYRVTDATYTADGRQLILFGAHGQPSKRDKEGNFPNFGQVQVYDLTA
jgi:WD40 repeat protein